MVAPDPPPVLDDYERPRSRSRLLATLRRIDGWGPGAWRETFDAWRLRGLDLALRDPLVSTAIDARARIEAELCLIPDRAPLPRDPADRIATCDWILRRAWSRLLDRPPLEAWTVRSLAAVRASNACFFAPARSGGEPRLHLRLRIALPFAGMTIDVGPLRRFLLAIEAFVDGLPNQSRPLQAHRRAIRLQQHLRAQLPARGLVAFLGTGSILARDAADRPLPGAQPLRVPRAWQVTLDGGPAGAIRGMGIPAGSTAITGAPYHGKSTLLRAIHAGIDDHPPGDGRERVVSRSDLAPLREDEGRRVSATDLRWFYPRLPSADAGSLSTPRASGATSMAAATVHHLAAGARLLLLDEDTAAGNFLHIDPGLRQLIGPSAAAARCLADHLPALEAAGISCVIAVGASIGLVQRCRQVVVMEGFQPRIRPGRPGSSSAAPLPAAVHRLGLDPERLLRRRHAVAVDPREPERPSVGRLHVDLRHCGWALDRDEAVGILAAAGWCCRLQADGCDLATLAERYRDLLAQHGAVALDPYLSDLLRLPPWQAVVAALTRLPMQAPRPDTQTPRP